MPEQPKKSAAELEQSAAQNFETATNYWHLSMVLMVAITALALARRR